MSVTSTLIEVSTIAVPAVVSIGSAIWATRAARTAQRAERDAARLLALEERISSKKYELYEPFVTHLGDILTPSRKDGAMARSETVIADFHTSVMLWGSDEVVSAFSRFRRASAANPPPQIIMRLAADLLLAIRRDVAAPETRATGMEILGSRINDLEEGGDIAMSLKLPFADVCAKYGWTPPFDL